MAPTANNPSYDRSVHKYLPWIHFHLILVPRNSGTNFKLEGVYVTGYRYMIHFYCLAVEAGFYSDVVECLRPGFDSRLGQVKYFRSTTLALRKKKP